MQQNTHLAVDVEVDRLVALLDESLVVSEGAIYQDYRTTGLSHGRGQQSHAQSAAAEVHVQFGEGSFDFSLGLGLGIDAEQVGALTPSKGKQFKSKQDRRRDGESLDCVQVISIK